MQQSAKTIRAILTRYCDPSYREFQARLIPTVSDERIIGVRIPQIRVLAKELAGTRVATDFLEALPHDTYDEDNLHAALLESMRDFDTALAAVERFLPYLDNWATCDGFCPKVLRRDPDRLWDRIAVWLTSSHVYTVRFALVRMTAWYLDDGIFSTDLFDAALAVKNDDYYVRMAIAWLFSIALVKQYDATLPYLLEHRLPVWIHNKAIGKAIDSYRISPARKQYLRGLRRRAESEENL